MTPEELAAALANALKPLQDGFTALSTRMDKLQTAPAPPAPAPQPAPTPAPAPAPAPAPVPAPAPQPTPAENALMAEMKRQLDETNKRFEDMQKREKEANDRASQLSKSTAIEKVLGDYAFVAPGARETARKLIGEAVQATDSGDYIANNLPLADYAKNLLTTEQSFLLAPAATVGSGATNGNGVPHIGRGNVATLEMIKPGMSPEDRAAVVASIQAALPR